MSHMPAFYVRDCTHLPNVVVVVYSSSAKYHIEIATSEIQMCTMFHLTSPLRFFHLVCCFIWLLFFSFFLFFFQMWWDIVKYKRKWMYACLILLLSKSMLLSMQWCIWMVKWWERSCYTIVASLFSYNIVISFLVAISETVLVEYFRIIY